MLEINPVAQLPIEMVSLQSHALLTGLGVVQSGFSVVVYLILGDVVLGSEESSHSLVQFLLPLEGSHFRSGRKGASG